MSRRITAVLDDRHVQAVVICTPTDTHARLVEEAAAAGKHIFCENPLPTRCRTSIAHWMQCGAPEWPFKLDSTGVDPNFARVRKAIAGGEIGEPHLMHIISRDPDPPPIEYIKSSGGIFLI